MSTPRWRPARSTQQRFLTACTIALGVGFFFGGLHLAKDAPSAIAQELSPSPATVDGDVSTRLCVGCHTPIGGPPLAGQLIGKWLAPNITSDPVSGVGAWTRDELFAYLRVGRVPGRGQAGGPMAQVVEMLAAHSDGELERLVDWMLSQPAHRNPIEERPASEQGEPIELIDSVDLKAAAIVSDGAAQSGLALYNGVCASCHGLTGAGSSGGHFPSLFHNSSVGRDDPANLVAALLDGIQRHSRDGAAMMQSFDGTRGIPGGLSDNQLAAVSNFVLEQFGSPAAPRLTADDIARSRLEWRGEGQPTQELGQLIAVGGGTGGTGSTCFGCHGLRGQGDAGSASPRLAGLDVTYFVKQMRDYAAGTRPHGAMSAIASELDELDYQSLALYYAALPPADAVTTIQPDPALLAAGEKLHLAGAPERDLIACADCHGQRGQGLGPVFPSLVQPGAYIATQLRLWRDGIRRNDPHDLMGSSARQLTDEDILALSAYLSELAP